MKFVREGLWDFSLRNKPLLGLTIAAWSIGLLSAFGMWRKLYDSDSTYTIVTYRRDRDKGGKYLGDRLESGASLNAKELEAEKSRRVFGIFLMGFGLCGVAILVRRYTQRPIWIESFTPKPKARGRAWRLIIVLLILFVVLGLIFFGLPRLLGPQR